MIWNSIIRMFVAVIAIGVFLSVLVYVFIVKLFGAWIGNLTMASLASILFFSFLLFGKWRWIIKLIVVAGIFAFIRGYLPDEFAMSQRQSIRSEANQYALSNRISAEKMMQIKLKEGIPLYKLENEGTKNEKVVNTGMKLTKSMIVKFSESTVKTDKELQYKWIILPINTDPLIFDNTSEIHLVYVPDLETYKEIPPDRISPGIGKVEFSRLSDGRQTMTFTTTEATTAQVWFGKTGDELAGEQKKLLNEHFFDLGKQEPGSYFFRVSVKDKAGNEGYTRKFVKEISAPCDPVLRKPDVVEARQRPAENGGKILLPIDVEPARVSFNVPPGKDWRILSPTVIPGGGSLTLVPPRGTGREHDIAAGRGNVPISGLVVPGGSKLIFNLVDKRRGDMVISSLKVE